MGGQFFGAKKRAKYNCLIFWDFTIKITIKNGINEFLKSFWKLYLDKQFDIKSWESEFIY